VTRLSRWLRSWHAWLHARSLARVGCCTCGGPTWDVAYFDALVPFPGKCTTDVPDWVACRACHDAPTREGAWFRSLRWVERADAERLGVL
jgi:hypothetical protein